MKKSLLTLFVVLAALVAVTATAEKTLWIYSHSGSHLSIDVADFDSLSFVDPTIFEISETYKEFESEGGKFTLQITTNQSWYAESNRPMAVTLSKTSGSGNGEIEISAMANEDTLSYSAIVTINTMNGRTQQLIVKVNGAEAKTFALSPEEKNMAAAGGKFDLYITTNQDWTAIVIDTPFVKLSKDTVKSADTIICKHAEPIIGTIIDTLSIDVAKNDSAVPYTRNVLIRLADGVTEQILPINVSVKKESLTMTPSSLTVPKAGGVYSVDVVSNTSWSVTYNESWIASIDTVGGRRPDTRPDSVSKARFDTITMKVTLLSDVKLADDKAKVILTTMGGTSKTLNITRSDKLTTTPASTVIPYEGGTSKQVVASNTSWTAEVNRDWASLSKYVGTENDTIDVTVEASTPQSKPDTATITISTAVGKTAIATVIREGFTGKGETVTDINGNVYPTIWIKGQNWMAEALKCDKYDTESEAYKAGIKSIPTSEGMVYSPYFVNAADTLNWITSEYADKLSSEQVAKLGYLYNWAAAVGVTDGNEESEEFDGFRQGVCPNGWHVPTATEWKDLVAYIGKATTVGTNLKSTSGWYNDGNGTDDYGFAALPSSSGYGNGITNVGYIASFWSTTTDATSVESATSRSISFSGTSLDENISTKYYAQSVRCLKN